MSAANRPSGGVRNLRALFENSDATSPEPRGRSPAASITSDTSLNRPASKIRASFVSVESSGFFPRESSAPRSTSRHDATSPLAQRRESFGLRQSRDSEQTDGLKKTMSNEIEESKKSVDMGNVDEVGPESAIGIGSTAAPVIDPTDKPTIDTIDTHPPEVAPHSAATIEAAALPTSPDAPTTEPLTEKTNLPEPAVEEEAPLVNHDKPTSVAEEPPVVMQPSDTADASLTSREARPEPQEPQELTEATSSTVADTAVSEIPEASETAVKEPKTEDAPGAAPAPEPESKPVAEKSNGSASIIAEAKAKLKSASASKPPAISTKTTTTKPAANSPTKTPTSATSKTAPPKPAPTTVKPPRASMASSTSSSTRERLSGSTSTGAFVKPKPRSPTRPVNLPSHLTQPTASSAAKHEAEAPAARKPAGRDRTSSFKPPAPAVKKASRASLPPQQSNRSESRTSAAAPDSGFLARMMRPTASSASKTHEKVEVKSPPRRAPAPAPAKPKSSTTASTASKVMHKVDEGVAKVKDAITSSQNGKHEKSGVEAKEESTGNGAGEATPDVTSTDLTAETPNFEGATIR